MLKLNSKSYKIIGISGVIIVIGVIIGFLIVRASPDFVSDTFTDETKISSKTNLTVSGGQVKLAIWTLNETTCNALTGWAWFTTNTRSACWSKALVDTVSWNKGVGDDSDNPGAYVCASGSTLQQRMEAAVAGEWYKIVESVDGHTMATNGTEDGQDGAEYISALAVTDCIDGTRDLCSTNGCLGSPCTVDCWEEINTDLRAWAIEGGKSALPYLATDAGTSQTDNDYWDACVQSDVDNEDDTLGCTSGNNYFHRNRRECDLDDIDLGWFASCGTYTGTSWDTNGRLSGSNSCSNKTADATSALHYYECFRAVVRP